MAVYQLSDEHVAARTVLWAAGVTGRGWDVRSACRSIGQPGASRSTPT